MLKFFLVSIFLFSSVIFAERMIMIPNESSNRPDSVIKSNLINVVPKKTIERFFRSSDTSLVLRTTLEGILACSRISETDFAFAGVNSYKKNDAKMKKEESNERYVARF